MRKGRRRKEGPERKERKIRFRNKDEGNKDEGNKDEGRQERRQGKKEKWNDRRERRKT